MPEFDSQDYYPILASSIRPGQVIPFDCFILLERVNRIVRWVNGNEIFPDSKYALLEGRSIQKVFVLKSDKQSYFAYLDDFLKSSDGRRILDLIKSQGKADIDGIPDPEEFSLTALQSEISTEPKANALSPLEQDQEDLIQFLKGKVNDIEENLTRLNQVPEEDLLVIGDVTLRISDELIKISSESLVQDEFEKRIKGVTQVIDDGLVRISGVSKKHSEFDGLSRMIEKISSEVHQLEELDRNGISSSEATLLLKRQAARIKPFSTNLSSSLASQLLGMAIEGAENHLGQAIPLKSNVGKYEELPTYLREMLTLKELMRSNSSDVKHFQHQILKQGLIIKDLKAKSGAVRSVYRSLRDKWFLFYLQAKKSLDPAGVLAANDLDDEIKKIEKANEGLFENSTSLFSNYKSVSRSVVDDQVQLNPNLLFNSEDSNQNERKEELSNGIQFTESDSVADENAENFKQIESENQILKVQNENLLSLVESMTKKGEELELILSRTREYTENLETANSENHKTIESLEERVNSLLQSQIGFDSMIEDMHRNSKLAKLGEEVGKERVADLGNQLDLANIENDALRRGTGNEAVVRVREEQFNSLLQKYENKQNELSEVKKTIINLNSKIVEAKTETKRLIQNMDRLVKDKDQREKQMRTVAIKFEMNCNLLKQSQSSVGKLTQLTDSLRQERQAYIRKTNEALNKYKIMTERASLLDRQVTAGEQSADDLQHKLSKVQERERNLRKESQEWRTKCVEAQKEIKSLEKTLAEFKKTA
ncbi:MAG: hypothetical protein IPL83_10265 [Bdellovibrionales bacterium]|nr:hypothetical protein [Bdellovibrionales bacterium]